MIAVAGRRGADAIKTAVIAASQNPGAQAKSLRARL